MMRWCSAVIFIVLLLLLCEAGTAYQIPENLRKIDPVLKSYTDFHLTPRAPRRHIAAEDLDMATIRVVVVGSVTPTAITSVGASFRSRLDENIISCDIPFGAFEAMANLRDVRYIQAARRLKPMLSISVPATGAESVWTSSPGYTGKGVIIGIIDSGIDWTHDAFRNPSGTSRILSIWDQTIDVPAQRPRGFPYGTEWAWGQIDAGVCSAVDADGHGTMMASISAGNGSISNGRQSGHQYVGMAPEAEFIIVKSNLFEDEVVDATRYIFDQADLLGMPVVINMSFGSHSGPHDGRDILDQMIDKAVDTAGVGRVVIAAAGNAGNDRIHVGGVLPAHSVNSYPWVALRPEAEKPFVTVRVWAPADSSLAVRLLLPEDETGKLSDLGQGWFSEGEWKRFIVPRGPVQGAVVTIDASAAPHPLYNDLDYIYLEIWNKDDVTIPIEEYDYGIEFAGEGVHVDAYARNAHFLSSFAGRPLLIPGEGEGTIATPGSAASVITVGSYVTRSEWVDSMNTIQVRGDLIVGQISDFSSRGPLRNGLEKPDLAAPGEVIIAARSADSWQAPRSIAQDKGYRVARGTSMATGHVTGAVALMLQQDSRLDAVEIKNMLMTNSIDKGVPGWDEAWGAGALSVLAAMGIPSPPKELRAVAQDGAVALTWRTNEENDIVGYRIYYNEQITDVGSVAETTLQGLSNGIPVKLGIAALDSSGNESSRSREIIATPRGDITPPLPPRKLSAIPGDGVIYLSWEADGETDVKGYRVYYRAGGIHETVVDVKLEETGSQPTYQLEDLANDTAWSVAITAYDNSGNESERSKEVRATPFSLPSVEIPLQSGWPLSIGEDIFSSPLIVDLDEDGNLEIIVGSNAGKVYAWHSDGKTFEGWPVSGLGPVASSAAAGDINNDGRLEVVVGAGNSIYIWHSDGRILEGWPVQTRGKVISSPALLDMNKDGSLEVVVGSMDGWMYAWDSAGDEVNGWPIRVGDYIYSSPALGDVDGDGEEDIVVTSGGGKVYVWHTDGSRVSGWPRKVSRSIYSSPALGDLDGDGDIELVVGSTDGFVYAWHHTGRYVSGWPVGIGGQIYASPALGDIDSGGMPEVIIGSTNGLVYALEHDGTAVNGWPVATTGDIKASASLGDIDNDGDIEVLVGATFYTGVGLVYAWHHDGTRAEGWPISTEGSIFSSSALGDLDGDGDIELVGVTVGGFVYAWDLPGRYSLDAIEWGMFRHDVRHTGLFFPDSESPFPPWDVNQDGVVDMIDLVLVVKHFGEQSPVVPGADVNGDGGVDISDLVLVGGHFGERRDGYPLSPGLAPDLEAAKVWLERDGDGSAFDEVVRVSLMMVSPVEVYGFQFDLSFDSDMAELVSITNGNLLQEGHSYWHTPRTDEQAGRAIGAATRIAARKGVSGSGKLASLTFRLRSEYPTAESSLILQDLKLASPDGRQIPIIVPQEALSLRHLIVPKETRLLQNYPNPFNAETWIPYQLANPGDVTIRIYSITGQLVRCLDLGGKDAGTYVGRKDAAYWDGRNDNAERVSSGMYFYTIGSADTFIMSRKMVLAK